MLTDILDRSLSDRDRDFLSSLEELCRRSIDPVRAELDATGRYPAEIIASLRQARVFEAMFPAELGGLGLSPRLHFFIVETLAEHCLALGTIVGASAGFAASPLVLAGTEEQKRKYLRRLVSGEWLGAFAVTEPDAGSDIFSQTTQAVAKDGYYVLNGTKKWITNAGEADLYLIMARTGEGPGRLSCFLVEKGTPGLSFGEPEDKLGLRAAPNRPVYLQDVEVPAEKLLGLKPNRGSNQFLRTVIRSRTGLAAMAVGLATGAYKEALDYTFRRQQFGHRILDFQVLQHQLADMLIKIETARSLTYRAVDAVIHNHRARNDLALAAKCYASEVAMEVATHALQLHGGYGFVKDHPIEKMFRDAKILAIYEGANQAIKNQIAETVVRQAARLHRARRVTEDPQENRS